MELKNFYSLNFLGRLFLSAIFINAIPSKILDFNGKTAFIANQGFPEFLSAILLFAAIVVLIAGSFLLIFTKKIKLGSSLLLIFLIPTTVIFHVVKFDPIHLIMNISLIGGLLLAIDKSNT
tara:strand:- start:100 stop:462 length:363 start_codon:yes stop_codon:yes gene_type:complete